MMVTERRSIWVLGGTGFIGSALVNRLSQDPANLLALLVHRRTDYRQLENFNIFKGSLETIDPVWFERYPPDVVFHLARPAGSNMLTRNLRAFRGEKANQRLVGILEGLRKPPVVVYVSGSLMYGPVESDNPAYEDTPLNPGAFAKAYYRNEKPWIEAQQRGRLDIRFARPGWIAGPASWFRKFFWEPYRLTSKVPCYGDGSQMMSVIHLTDCAAMIESLSLHQTPVNALNIFAVDPLSQLEFSTKMASLLQKETEMIPFRRLVRMYGSTTARALTLSIPMKTRFPLMHLESDISHPTVELILSDVVRLLKNEE
ncbi:MAG: NAD(P)-dependent oxidoreductase [Bacteroidales bacterium]|nr:NAD(P)-dependent oxidoreductase [Bacteroidales bacterium]